MGHIYIINEAGHTIEMDQYFCKNEDKDLQSLLERSPELLAGDQINPDDHRRWILIKREMPVEDPNTAENRWSIDFFYADQDGTPTFVECKRFLDTRSRREVVGQMLDYAANGQFYFSKEKIGGFISEQANKLEIEPDQYVMNLDPTDCTSINDFLELIDNNLREGQIRMIFFMEEAPMELKSIVDFLNKQMERSEMLIVEAKQFEKDNLKIVVPSLFGYTEQARMIKKTVTVKSASHKSWDEQSYFEKLRDITSDSTVIAKQKEIYRFIQNHPDLQVKFGTGKETGSISCALSKMSGRNILGLNTNGNICFNFGNLSHNDKEISVKELFLNTLIEKTTLTFPTDVRNKFHSKKPTEWVNHTDTIIAIIDDLTTNLEEE
jgi:hypothetical protein